jgi:hypothetical protein
MVKDMFGLNGGGVEVGVVAMDRDAPFSKEMLFDEYEGPRLRGS